ncbi:MAG: SulP family inorganic anion transporter, partial [bacterium]
MSMMSSGSSPSKKKKKQSAQSPIRAIFPFLRWFDHLNSSTIRADLISGITVALVLVPQSMAYAQLAGLPAYYGLYAAFLPPVVAAMFGSSHQLATGPVAVVSLMTATALAPLATAGSASFIAYAILLALMVGLVQFLLGVFRLGLIVNFLSHPVVNGFTNAAAIIIATSQLAKLFGVSVDRYEHHYETIYQVIKSALVYTHWPTLLLALLAFGLMFGLKRINKRIPNVLVAVVVTTLISYLTGFEKNRVVTLDAIQSAEVQEVVEKYNALYIQVDSLTQKRFEVAALLKEAERQEQVHSIMDYEHALSVLNWILHDEEELIREYREEIRLIRLDATGDDNQAHYHLAGTPPEGVKVTGKNWRIKVKNQPLDPHQLAFIGGGQVVGNIP